METLSRKVTGEPLTDNLLTGRPQCYPLHHHAAHLNKSSVKGAISEEHHQKEAAPVPPVAMETAPFWDAVPFRAAGRHGDGCRDLHKCSSGAAMAHDEFNVTGRSRGRDRQPPMFPSDKVTALSQTQTHEMAR
ncbi:hypothetical protein DNTS_029573 [Danionella cerebrum]|uniref:Uncharacterized protein n=1 Tax=Danionella cerebrum TaxID=2873325 RepID=A0A553QRI0_9TELE|nr:hypothetical protein DNTS_029573 [Danionella translucida]